MKLVIQNKSNFVRGFLSPLNKIDQTPDIKIKEGELSCFVDRGGDIFLFSKFKCDTIDIDVENIVLPDANKFIKSIQCIDSDDISLDIKGNYIRYNSNGFKFKYYLFDRSIKRSNDHVYKQLEHFEKNFDTRFTLTRDYIKTIIKILPLVTESSKLYLYTDNNNVYGDVCDKKLQNTDQYTNIISDTFEGDEIEENFIIINIELFRMLNALHIDTADVYINKEFKIVNIKCIAGDATLNYVISSHKN